MGNDKRMVGTIRNYNEYFEIIFLEAYGFFLSNSIAADDSFRQTRCKLSCNYNARGAITYSYNGLLLEWKVQYCNVGTLV